MTEHEPEAAQPPVEGPSSSAPPPSEAPPVAPPIVAWETTAAPTPTQDGWPIGITIGGVLSDTFARYAADPIRIFLVGLIPSILTLLASDSRSSSFPLTFVSLLSTSVILVLADRGPRVSLGYAFGLGVRRVGWVLLTLIVIGLAAGLLALIPVFIVLNEFGPNPGLAIVLGLITLIPVGWVLMRLILATPAVVVDDLNTSAALGRAREATRGRSAVLSLFAILFVADLAVVPVTLGAGALSVLDGVPSTLVLLLAGVLVALVTPLGTIAQLSAYRRAFPPEPEPPLKERPAWLQNPVADEAFAAPSAAAFDSGAPTGPVPAAPWAPVAAPTAAQPIVAPIPSPEAAAPAPAFGRVARGIAGVTIAIGILGVGAFGFAIFSSVAGSLGNAGGNVPAGTVAFGSQGSLQSCSVYGQATTMAAKTDTVFIGHFRRPATSSDEVRLRVSLDGTEIINEVEKPGSYVCLGSDTPETDIEAGTYHFAIYLNDELTAEGTLIVH